jgi:hypothetical protein
MRANSEGELKRPGRVAGRGRARVNKLLLKFRMLVTIRFMGRIEILLSPKGPACAKNLANGAGLISEEERENGSRRLVLVTH